MSDAVCALVEKEAIEIAPPSPGFYSRLFVTPKVTEGWRPVIDLSRLNGWMELSSFRMETAQSVLQALRPGDWMVSLDLQDAYLQVPVHPASHRFLRFCVGDAVFQFRTLCFGLSSAPRSVHPHHGSYFFHHASPRFSSSSLSRRLAGPGLHLPGSGACEGLPPLAMSSPRGHSQSFEELFSPDSDVGLSQDDTRDFSFEGFPDPQTDSEVFSASLGVFIRPSPACVGLEESSRDDVVHVCHRSGFSAPYAIPSTSPQCSRASLARRSSCLLGRWLPQGSSVVVRRIPSSRRLFTGRLPPRSLSVLRRLGSGLGCGSRRPPSVWLMVSPLLQLFHQSARAPGYSLCHSGFSASPQRSDCGRLLRQLYSSDLSPEAGRHPFVVSQRHGSGTSSPLRGSVGSSSAAVHSGTSQCPGGFPQPSL